MNIRGKKFLAFGSESCEIVFGSFLIAEFVYSKARFGGFSFCCYIGSRIPEVVTRKFRRAPGIGRPI